jgi:hypothetical protein
VAFGELFGFGGQFNLHPTAVTCSGEGAVAATGDWKRVVGGLVSCHLGRERERLVVLFWLRDYSRRGDRVIQEQNPYTVMIYVEVG